SLFVASSAQVAASTGTGLALGALVYSSAGSPLLSALVMFGPALAQVAGALALGVVSSLGGGVRYGLMNEIVPPDGYMLGRSVLNMSVGIMQIVGFAAGGVLVTVMSPRGTLLAGAGLYVVSGVLTLCGLSR